MGVEAPAGTVVIPGCVTVQPDFLADEEGAALFESLKTEVVWEQKHLTFGSKVVPLPRLVAWYGDPGADYRYSGIRNVAQPWTAALAGIKPKLDALLPRGLTFNGVLLNYYRNGSDKIGFHADDEKELGESPFIASLSIGSVRRFLLRRKTKDRKARGKDVEIALDNGTLVLMYGRCQQEWLHSVPAETAPTGPRINLTLRQIGGR